MADSFVKLASCGLEDVTHRVFEALVVGPPDVTEGADRQGTSLSQWSDRSRRWN